MALLPVRGALDLLLRDVQPISASESVPLSAAFRRVLAGDLIAQRTQPSFDASAMDGYAVRASDVRDGARLQLIGEAPAGRAFGGTVGPGQTVRIFTGAPVPEGADAVLIQEHTEIAADGAVIARDEIVQGANIRPAGNDFREGQTLLARGSVLAAGAVALAASGGHPALWVRRKPVVAILATGSELVLPGEPVGPAQIVASNSFGIAALVEANGGTVLDLGIAPDDVEAIAACVDRAADAGADIFVSIGGASVGDHDLAAKAYEIRGADLDFWKVAMRPGKPIMAGQVAGMRLVGLPGNPASSMVAATVFLRPLLRRMAGLPDAGAMLRGRLGATLRAGAKRAEFVRASVQLDPSDPRPLITPLPRQDSSLLSIYAAARVLLFREAHAPEAASGEDCLYLPID